MMRTTGPAQPIELLLDVLEVVAESQIPYAVVGALAVSYHGVPRSTADADVLIWIAKSQRTLTGLMKDLTAAGYRAKRNLGDVNDPIPESIQVEDVHGNRIDILLGIRGMEPDAASRCISTVLMGTSIQILGAEDLVAMKVLAAGSQDIEDVRGILQVSGETLDTGLLRRAVAGFGKDAATLLERLLTEDAAAHRTYYGYC